MPVITERFNIKTRGFNDIIDITHKVNDIVARHSVDDAQVMVYEAGSDYNEVAIFSRGSTLPYYSSRLLKTEIATLLLKTVFNS